MAVDYLARGDGHVLHENPVDRLTLTERRRSAIGRVPERIDDDARASDRSVSDRAIGRLLKSPAMITGYRRHYEPGRRRFPPSAAAAAVRCRHFRCACCRTSHPRSGL